MSTFARTVQEVGKVALQVVSPTMPSPHHARVIAAASASLLRGWWVGMVAKSRKDVACKRQSPLAVRGCEALLQR